MATAPVADADADDSLVMAINAMGGQLQRIAEDSSAMPRGDAAFYWESIAMNRKGSDADWMGHIDKIASVLRPRSSSQIYLNHFSAAGQGGRELIEQAYGPEKYARLAKIKAKWDPDNVFRFNKNIEPAGG